MVSPVARPICWVLSSALLLAGSYVQADPQGIKFFETKIRPVLATRCYKCHGKKKQESELRLDSYAAILKGGATGPAVVPGKPQEGLLIHVIEYEDEELQMPPDRRLSNQVIKDFKHWITIGVPHPDAGKTTSPISPRDDDQAAPLWSLQNLQHAGLPKVKNTAWPTNFIDYYVLARLETEGLKPAPRAARTTLIRRLAFDLTGLPPGEAQVRDFLADHSATAYSRLVDSLLASPAYGERWGRHWLDVARYADSNGLDENIAHGNAWRYRDYVIEAFNQDKPFDTFIHEQLAGDLMTEQATAKQARARLTATGFLSLGPKVLAESDISKMEMDIIDEQIDTIGRAFMGLTFGCARCHDHKFDPISTEDYYGLAGILKSTRTMETFKRIARWHENSVATPAQQEAHQQQLETITKLKAQIKQATDQKNKTLLAQLQKQLVELEKNAPPLPTAMGVQDQQISNLKVHIRGSHLNLGREVPRRVPQMFVSTEVPKFPADQSGRLQLASWLTAADHPLTSRVIANRIWRWHFGRGIVATPNNFGTKGQRPTHPKLLDHLALKFIRSGWSLKSLHLEILNSSTYQMASNVENPAAMERDPANVLLWKREMRRMEAEVFRDSLLHLSGRLRWALDGGPMRVKSQDPSPKDLANNQSFYENSDRRSVYLPVVRSNVYDLLTLLDFPNAATPVGSRVTTTVPTQALLMMNGDYLMNESRSIAKNWLNATDKGLKPSLNLLYEALLTRSPTPDELEWAKDFLEDFLPEDPDPNKTESWNALCHTLVMSNDFIHVR